MSTPNFNTFTLVLNQSNLVTNSNNNLYRYVFPGAPKFLRGTKVALVSASLYYSWYSITAAIGNNTFSYTFPTFAGSITIAVTIPDGFYTIPQLNSFLQFTFISNGHYLVDASGDYVYYAQFSENPALYAVQFDSFPVPTALPAGYTNPAALTFPAVASTPLLIVGATLFRNIIGFNAGTYPAVFQATNYSRTSAFTPQVTPTSSVVITCSLIRNALSNPQTILASFSPDVGFGSLIQVKPNQYNLLSISDGTNQNSLDIQFLDQNFVPLKINDSQVVIELLVSIPMNLD